MSDYIYMLKSYFLYQTRTGWWDKSKRRPATPT